MAAQKEKLAYAWNKVIDQESLQARKTRKMLGKMSGPMSVIFSYLDPDQRTQMQALSKEYYHFKIPVIVDIVLGERLVIIR